MKVFNDVYEVEIPQEQDKQIKDMQSVVDKITKALHKGTGGYYNDSLIEIEGICREIIGDFWYNNENVCTFNTKALIPKYSHEISKENNDLIFQLNEQLTSIKKMVKIEQLMDSL
tara:strand:- start:69 stop:413 length:345 start_codon:yes stop_codon:yes gene_type:complete